MLSWRGERVFVLSHIDKITSQEWLFLYNVHEKREKNSFGWAFFIGVKSKVLHVELLSDREESAFNFFSKR